MKSALTQPGAMETIEVVSASRLNQHEFAASPLGVSLARIERDRRIAAVIAFENTRGLPEVYNARIDQSNANTLVFVHDDVWLEDFYFADRVLAGLEQFDVLGVAGNSRRQPFQSAWAYPPEEQRLDLPHLRGAVAHGEAPLGKVGFFGPIVGTCELLDGVFLAAKRDVLIQNHLGFDPRFPFHFYDLDFSRAARARGLRLGTWPISMTHRSTGNPFTRQWEEARDAYFAKWGG